MRHKRMVAPINSIKHYVQFSTNTLAAATALAHVLVDAVVAPATSNTFDVEEGSIVKAVFLELWLSPIGTSGQTGQQQLIIEKVPANQASVTLAQSVTLMAYPNKKNIFYHTQGIIGVAQDGQAVPIIRNWFMIPKGKQRMGFGDRIVATLVAGAEPLQNCGFSTYKEYR